LGLSPTGLGSLADSTAAAGRRAVDVAGTIRPIFEDRRAEARVITEFRLAARLINADLGIRFLSILFGDFDTHANQATMHRSRMMELNAGLETFFATLAPQFSTRTLVVGTSEFGRRVKFNGSGTDHGRANSLFAMGHQVNGGIHGRMPSLTRLDRGGNLEPSLDVRQLYSNVVTTWLRADANQVIGRQYGDLGILNPPGRPVTGKTAPTTSATATIRQRRAQVSRLHLALFQTEPAEAALEGWSAALVSGARSLGSLANELTRSHRFTTTYGALSNREFVDLVYRNVLDRKADASGLGHWVGVLDSGTPRGTVVLNFSESSEFRNKTAAWVWRIELVGPIGRLYRAYFLRRPDERGLTYWINSGLALPTISHTFATSTEFLNRYGVLGNEEFVQLIYHNVLGRAAENKGFRYWLDQLNRGTPRGDIMLGFSNSTEFIRKVRLLD
jgi:hypothetical protein